MLQSISVQQREIVLARNPEYQALKKAQKVALEDKMKIILDVGYSYSEGEPFVGAAGQLLTKIIQTMGLSRDTVYIGNILKCRPDTPGLASGNRKPTAEEMKTCIPYLHSQIDIIQPKVLVALGATAVEGLLGPIGGITKIRGRWHEYRGIPLMPTFHPAYLLRNMALAEKRKVWEDMLQVMERLNMAVNDKQRGFFLPKST